MSHQHRGEVVVTHTGVGLAGQDIERVSNGSTGRRVSPDGPGIGLTIARGIARGHGDDVTATSAGPGQGASFTLALPRHSPDRSAAAHVGA